MQRTLRDDLTWALCLLVGATAGYLLLGADDPSLLLDFVIGAALLVVVLGVLRRARARRKA
jgi:predicted branched-subunit amino acid permease